MPDAGGSAAGLAGENSAPSLPATDGPPSPAAASDIAAITAGADVAGISLLREGVLRPRGPVRIAATIEKDRYLATMHGKERKICARSLYIFDALGPVRQHILWLVEWRWFEHSVLFLILFSSVNLAIYSHRDPDSPVNDFIDLCDPCLTVCFTLESFFKVIAYGLICDRGSYLRSGWNWLDFIVVISGWLDELPTNATNLRFLLVFKVLRPLRSLTVMPQMRLLVNTVLLSMKRLSQFCLMVVFLFSVFSIVGLNFFSGVMHRQCRATDKPEWNAGQACWSWPLAEQSSGRLCGGRYSCEAGNTCGTIYLDDPIKELRPKFDAGSSHPKPGRTPGTGAPWCKETRDAWNSEDLNFRLTHFDHIAGSLLIVFQCMTLEGWVDLMYLFQDGDSDIVASIYFVVLIVATAFFLLNAALAIVTETFEDEVGSKDEKETQEEQGTTEDSSAQSWATTKSADNKGANQKKVVPEAVGQDVAGRASASKDSSNAVLIEEKGHAQPTSASEDDEEEFMEDIDFKAPPWLDTYVVRVFRVIASNDWFTNIVMVFILFNVLTMCLDRYPPPSAGMQSFLQVCNYIFAVAFTVEMIVLLIAMGPWSYMLTLVTAFDGAVVIASWVEIFMSGGGGAVRAFRGLRLLRIFKLAKKLVSLRIMLKAMWNTVTSLGNLAVLLFVMLFIFTLMGRDFFACKFHFDDNGHLMSDDEKCYCNSDSSDFSCVPRAHFDTFIWAFVTVFQILTGENWNVIMYDGMKSNLLLVFYFVVVMVFGQFIMLSLFLAVLMSKFEESRTHQQAVEAEKKKKLSTRWSAKSKVTQSLAQIKNSMADRVTNVTRTLSRLGIGEDQPEEPGAGTDDAEAIVPSAAPTTVKKHDRRFRWYKHNAFFVLSPENPLRVACRSLVENKLFDQAVLVCICISSLAMALDDPMADPEGVLKQTLYWMGVVFTVIFTIEMLLKMITYGCFCGGTLSERAYWLQPWNVLDGVVVIVSVLDIVLEGPSLGAMKTLRIVRALRPLRVVARFQNLRLVVQTLFKSVPALANVLVVGVLVFLIFALFFLSYFKGKFYACMAPDDNGDLEGVTFDKNVTYVLQNLTHGPLSAFSSTGEFLNLPAAEMARLVTHKPTPLCLNVTSGIVTALGDIAGNRFVVGSACPAGQELVIRPTRDTPICVGRCNPRFGKDDRRPAHCPAPPEEVSELPSFCPNAADRAPHHISEAERRGQRYYDSLKDRKIMFCGAPPEFSLASSCVKRFCPDGCPEPPCDDRIDSCKSECKAHLIYCTDSCKEGREDTQDCVQCRRQCEAQCQCQEFCDGFVKDAGNCVEQQGRWLQALSQDFDNIFTSFLTLVEISTTEGWVDVMYQAVDAVDPHMEPVRDNEEIWSVAFMFFIFVSTFFYLNLCVGVIVDNYNMIKENGEQGLLTKYQMDWISTQKCLHKRTIFFGLTHLDKAPALQVFAYRLISRPAFENFIMFCIVGNTMSMAVKQFPKPSDTYEDVRQAFNTTFGVIFFIEMVIKLFALRLNYFKENWNIFDCFCVLSTVAGMVISIASDVQMASAMSAIRAFRIARLFRLVRFLKGLNRMFTALLLSLPKLINVGAILLLFFFLFSVLGVQLFAKTKFTGPHGVHANFRNPLRAFLTLLRSITGEGWNEIMHALARDLTYYAQSRDEWCIQEDMLTVDKSTYPILSEKCLVDNPNACGKDLSYVYFFVFLCVMTMVLVNLMIAVILEAFTDSASSDLMEVINTCIKIWPTYDHNLSLKLPLAKTFSFIFDVAREHQVAFDEPAAPGKAKSQDNIFSTQKLETMYFHGMRMIQGDEDKEEEPGMTMEQVPMAVARLCKVKVLPDGQVHMLYAVQMAVAVTLSHNSLSVMTELEHAERHDHRLKHLRTVQVKKIIEPDDMKASVSLQEQVGASKIQALYRVRKKWKQKQGQKEGKVASIRQAADEVVQVLEVKDDDEVGSGVAEPAQLTPREAG